MTSLDKLIRRIEYPLKVSTEDALDVIQKYWDDAANTVSTYWNDTDDEIAEEVGIPKLSLTEILDQHGNGQAYANIGGNSGVDSYVDGYGWILVNFTTGAKYLYTTKSTSDANIDQMKQYAREGKGLNSFIMRIARDGYAGNNIKGNILIRPGMEHYTTEANKRLNLLYAFRNTQMRTARNHEYEPEQIGMESIEQLTANKYGKLLDNASADGLDVTARRLMAVGLEHLQTPGIVADHYKPVTSVEGIWSSIKDFFAGRPDKIHLAGSDRGLRNKLDRTINDPVWLSRQKYTLGEVKYKALPNFTVENASKIAQDYIQSVTSVTQHNKREMGKIRERLDAVPRIISLYANKTIMDLNALHAAVADISPNRVRLNVQFKEPELIKDHLSVQTGEALTKIEVKKFAELISKVHASQSEYERGIWINPVINIMPRIQQRYGRVEGGAAVIKEVQKAIFAYGNTVMLVNRQVKQYIETHAAWINAENIADSMVNYIGKSLSNITTNSMESFNTPLVPSNEDLITAIKKFFTKGKDTEIYDTVGKGFLQSLKKEVEKYTDIGWVKTHGQNKASKIEINGANLIADYDTVVTQFIKDCQVNRQSHHKAAEQAFKNMDEVMSMIGNKKLSDSSSVERVITILKATRQIKAPVVEVPKATPTKGVVKTLTPDEVVAKAKKLLELFNTLGADTTFVDRWNSDYINSQAWMDWKFMSKTDSKILSEQAKNPKVVELYQKTMEHVYDLRRIGSEFHKLQPYIMTEFQLIEKSVGE